MPPLSLIRSASALGLATALLMPSSAVAQVADGGLAYRLSTWYEATSHRAPGQWGIAVADQTGRILWSVNPHAPMVPASTVKLFTTGFARSMLGGAARRSTRVVGIGGVDPKTGAWVGSWALELNGDPTLERAQGSGPTLYDLALQLASGGIRKLTGPLLVQSADGPANAIYPTAWSNRHRGRLFAPPVGPLTLHENIVWLTVRPGTKVGRRARLVETAPEAISSLVTVTATTKAGRRSRLGLSRRKDGGWIVSGTIGIRASQRRLTAVASDPKVVLNAVWGSALARAGISWNRAPYIGAPPEGSLQILAEVASAPLDSLASEINRRSLNLGAELLLQWAGGRDRAPERLTQHVRDVIGSSEGVYLTDGSGLSYDDRVAPSAFISYLAKFPATAAGQNFPQLLPANGTGTLRRLNSGFPGEGVVRAKTGTLGQVSTVVGYLGGADGVLLVSLMYNGPRPWAARQAQWKLFRDLGADGVVIPTDSTPAPPVQMGGDSVAVATGGISR
ncbi:MAG: D-alanyl-D-alanine carboxypeptidase/D-alanyl-D-alanine-endopeptidase [Gemmatimonadales bacterium]|nr:D-alanyl-D-alanine carboxypeptidase/D-alanyl-D-alanine-endopeptidase [Gemmatimonadales bacterium]